MDESLRERLRRVDEDELRALLADVLGDEGVDDDRERLDPRVSDRRRALLAVDDPARLVLVIERDDERSRSATAAVSAARDSKRTRSSKATTIPFGIIGDGDSR